MSNQINLRKFFYQIIKPYKFWYFLMMLTPLVSALFIPVSNYSLKLIIDNLAVNQNFTISDIIFPVSIFCIAVFVSQMIWRVFNYGDYKSQPFIEANIINKAYAMLLEHNYQFFQNNLSGKTASQIATLRDKYVSIHDHIFQGFTYCVLTILITLIIFFNVHQSIAIANLLWLAVSIPVIFYSKKKIFFLSKNSTEAKQKITGLLNDSIANISTVLHFANRNFEKKLLANANEDFVNLEKKRIWFININHFWIGLIYAILPIVTLFLMIDLRQKNIISIGDFVLVLALMFHLFDHSWAMLQHLDGLINDYGQLSEAFTIFDDKNLVKENNQLQNLKITNPQIIFENVNFKYSENLVLENFSLTINSAQKIGLVGHSGAGKSTLVNLLLKIFINYTGKITINQQCLTKINNDDLRSNIAVIPQDPALFHRSIFENIAYGNPNASRDEVIESAKKAHIHEFISSLANGYDTLVGERGVKLSGGQKQRIAIARALLKNASILILDEATSSLDSKTESEIQQSILEILKLKNITVIAIAHRLSTIKNMDRIIVLEDGKITEDDNFENLLAKNHGKFKEMWSHQINGMIN
jgi:ATP-binding cassette subfamily B protein